MNFSKRPANFRPMVPDLPQVQKAVKAGPVDEGGWTVLVANAAISAKLRQLQPRLMDTLAQKGLKVSAIRIRVQTA
jgi:hypothetical protein